MIQSIEYIYKLLVCQIPTRLVYLADYLVYSINYHGNRRCDLTSLFGLKS